MKAFLLLVILVGLFTVTSQKILASPNNNPIFATIDFTQNLFDSVNPTVQQNQNEIKQLKEKVDKLENNSLPEEKWVHVCFNVATQNLYVMKNGNCSPDVHWKISVQCYPGTPCIPNNSADTYFVPPQEH